MIHFYNGFPKRESITLNATNDLPEGYHVSSAFDLKSRKVVDLAECSGVDCPGNRVLVLIWCRFHGAASGVFRIRYDQYRFDPGYIAVYSYAGCNHIRGSGTA